MEVGISYSVRNKYAVDMSDIISMLEDFDTDIETLENDNKINEELLEEKDIKISEKDDRIAYLEDLLRQNNIDY